jgi:hypothetical protein
MEMALKMIKDRVSCLVAGGEVVPVDELDGNPKPH